MTVRKAYLDSKIVQVLAYLVWRLGEQEMTMLPLLKLVYFADRYHLRKYGRLVTDDDYFAMHLGPVASETKRVIEEIEKGLGAGRGVLSGCGSRRKAKHIPICLTGEVELNELSVSDVEALDRVVEKYGRLTPRQLAKQSHHYPEWIRASRHLNERVRRYPMPIVDFFLKVDNPKDEYCDVPEEHVQLSKRILMSA